MLSIKNPINADDIHSASILAPGHPVFKLEGFGNSVGKIDAIVVKQEGGHGQNVAMAAMTMSIVDKNSRQVPLSPVELQALRTFAAMQDQPTTESFRASMEIVKVLAMGGTWIKMDVKRLMDLKSAGQNLAAGDKSDVRVIANALRKPGGLEKLGEIIAADLFNGSNDRFAYPAMKNLGVGNVVVQNQGNIFIDCSKIGAGKPVGLDNYDPFSQQRHMSGQEATNMDLGVDCWGGHLLKSANKTKRDDFIKSIVADLEFLLGGARNRKIAFASKNRLGNARTARISKGMDNGTKLLKKAFAKFRVIGQQQNKQFAEGISRKLAVLGW